MGRVYLIHFDKPIGNERHQAQHYIGYASKSIKQRLADHRSGNGARIMQVVHDLGIDWKCVRTWPGTRKDERRLKNWKKSRQLCPICRGERV